MISMADRKLSMVEGLGIKALDSNELRRKQDPCVVNPNSSIPYALDPPDSFLTTDVDLQTTITRSDLQSSSHGFGAHSPKSSKNPSPARKLQQVFFEEGLKLEAEEAIRATSDMAMEKQ